MKIEWLHRENSGSLLIFFNGWGMDGHPFRLLSSDRYDVLMCFDYTNEAAVPDVEKLAEKYSTIILAAWSMGVAYAQRLFAAKRNFFQQRIAINGTLCPIHDTFGIPVDIFNSTLTNISEKTILNFYHRMCRSRQILGAFLENRPLRTVNSQKEELQTIFRTIGCIREEESIYTDVIISKKDLIIPTANQLHFWHTANVSLIPGFHFPFYQWKSWDQLVMSTEV
jgi:biotin synthesis protein BioG